MFNWKNEYTFCIISNILLFSYVKDVCKYIDRNVCVFHNGKEAQICTYTIIRIYEWVVYQ